MEKINVNPIIKEELIWVISNCNNYDLNKTKETYLNKFVTDGKDVLHVTNIKFTPTGFTDGEYVIELIDNQKDASKFLEL